MTSARRLPVPQFFREWPSTFNDLTGRMDSGFFTSREPAGHIRLLRESDVSFCRELYAHLERRRQVPAGFSESLEQWLREPETLRLAIEFDGTIAGCAGFSLNEETNSAVNDTEEFKVACLSFGLIHPRFQRHGLGTTLLAFRLAAACQAGHPHCTAMATSCSVDYLERAGFRFYSKWHSTSGESLFNGGMVLTGENAITLETWLGPERSACLRSLPIPPLRNTRGSGSGAAE